MTSGCRLLCFDEFHLHDPGDAMLIKVLLEHLFQHGIVLLATSNYPPEMLLPNPLYHDRFLPSIALIRAHLAVVALNGEEDYRERHLSQDNAFCSGRMWVNPNAQQRQLYDLPSLPGEPVSLTVGYRTCWRPRRHPLAALHLCPALSGRHGGDGLSDAQRKLCRLVTGRGAAAGYGGAGGPAALYQRD
jgi:cell division protein ZapE